MDAGWIEIPDSEVDDCMDDTVEVEDSDMDRRLWIASTWELSSSKRLRRYLERQIGRLLDEVMFLRHFLEK